MLVILGKLFIKSNKQELACIVSHGEHVFVAKEL